jgi:tRNA(Ile)-lysidine synthase
MVQIQQMVVAIKTFLRTIISTVTTCGLFQTGDSVLIGVSGGPDSVALLHGLRFLTHCYRLRLGIAHLNHCLRQAASDRDEAFVVALSQELGLPCFVERADVNGYRRERGLSLEEAAREIRYDFLEKTAVQYRYTKIALGHHADDNAELILMCLLRGSGALGLSGMQPIRDGKFVRPLIRISRGEILQFLEAQKIPYVLDESNDDPRFTRNRIRHHLLPELKQQYNPRIVAALNRLGVIFDAEESWMNEMTEALFEKLVRVSTDEKLALSLPHLKQQPVALQRRLLRKAIERLKGNLKGITLEHIDAIICQFAGKSQAKYLTLPQGLRIRFERKGLCFTIQKQSGRAEGVCKSESASVSFTYYIENKQIGEMPFDCCLHEIGMKIRFFKTGPLPTHIMREAGQQCAFFDMEKIKFPLTLRNRRPGDRFTPLGMTGHQKVKDFFINRKVPGEQKEQCPLLLSREQIIWVVGYQIDDAVKVNLSTRNVLKAELLVMSSDTTAKDEKCKK